MPSSLAGRYGSLVSCALVGDVTDELLRPGSDHTKRCQSSQHSQTDCNQGTPGSCVYLRAANPRNVTNKLEGKAGEQSNESE